MPISKSRYSLHQLFEAQVERTPEAIAVSFDNQCLTYRALNLQANRIAHALIKADIGPETLVGLAVERSLELVIGLLGILKAGGAYVPLDITAPKERLALQLKDAHVSVLLTQARLAEDLLDLQEQIRMICLDTDWESLAQESITNPVTEVQAENLAYVIYTSGSTGKPKGVLVTHANVVRLFQATDQWFRFDEHDVWTLFHSCAFDFSVWELWGALLVGGRLVVVSYWESRSSEEFSLLLRREQVTVLNQTPSAFRAFIQAESSPPATLRQVIFGGEALDMTILKPWFEQDQAPRFVNMYGITETTVHVTSHLVTANDISGAYGSVIGNPIPDLQLHVLDHHLRPVPRGVPGELYISGRGLARGYLHRSDLTAERFVPHPFSDVPGMRLYKTGDLVRYQHTGELEYLGRVDQQVKLRGFRIELGEIEAHLYQHPQVRDAVVVMREDVPGDKRLVAYLVLSRAKAITITDLRDYLKQRLPDYMIPSIFVFLEAIPLTANGKVDRRALPVPNSIERETIFVAPRTPIEEMLASIFTRVLSLRQISIYDNFFALGGHSLLGTQLISRIRSNIGIELSLRRLFEAPTIAELVEDIEVLLLTEKRLSHDPITRVSREDDQELSFAQQRLWFLDQLKPKSSFYNILEAFRLTGQLHIATLERSLNVIVQRHESLRTTFTASEGRPIQVVTSGLTFTLPIIDLSEVPEAEREYQLSRLLKEESQRPFSLSNGPLLRVNLVRLDEREHILFLAMHHIISDGWSVDIFYRELAVLYSAFLADKPSPLPELAVQYADFAAFQHKRMQDKVLETQLGYWKRQLANLPALLELPTDHPRPAVESFRGAMQSFVLSASVSEELKILSQREGVTLFMTLLAAFQILLFRYTGQEDVVVGSPIANRGHIDVEGLIGFFVNMLVLRTDLSGDPGFCDLLKRVREVALGAYTHQDLPFEKLVEELQPERDLSRHPLFQVMFTVQNAPRTGLEFTGLSLLPLKIETHRALCDLAFTLEETEQGLAGIVEYNTDLFEATTIERMIGHFQVLLAAIVNNPEQHISLLSLLAQQEQHQILVEWNATKTDYLHVRCLQQIFEGQVEQRPDNLALSFEDEQLTYLALNQRANQVAHYLQALGIRPGNLVGICVERSPEMLVGILGILKTGSAYVPLDPSYPRDRLAFILEDTQVPILLTQHRLLERLPRDHQAGVISLDLDRNVFVQESMENVESTVTPDDLAYLMYTSGSTGQPKGVMVSHRAIVNRLLWGLEDVGLSSVDHVLQIASFSFDISIWEFCGPLFVGAKIILAKHEGYKDSIYLLSLLSEQQVTVAHFVPSLLQVLLEEPAVKTIKYLRCVLCGGEALTPELARHFFSCLNNIPLHHLYGPTEAAISMTSWICPQQNSLISLVPIGRPIANMQVYLLDRHLQPVHPGVLGEVYIGGIGLAWGYLHRPELTAERFIPNPFNHEPGSRLYRTGDLARYLPAGDIVFVGRIDSQVKVRGHRIELGEIETTLVAHPSVRETVIPLREDVRGDKRLVAYVILKQKHICTSSDLRHYLQSKLPDYMVPSAFVFLEAFPLTPNGKRDRRALPVLDTSNHELEANFVAPRSPIEESLVEIWAIVLNRKQIGIYDNFFALGGHSLLVTQVISRIRTVFQIELSLRSLFEAPTVVELAQSVEAALHMGQSVQKPPILPTRRVGDIPLSFAQQRLWFLNQMQPDNPFYNIPAVLRLLGPLNMLALRQSLQEIVRRHEALRTTFSEIAGEVVQIITPTPDLPLRLLDLQNYPEDKQQALTLRLAEEEAECPFNLKHDPLIRATLLRLSEEEHVLLLTMHHIVADGWSFSVLYRELTTLYTAFSAGKPSPLHEPTIQYADFAMWQRQWLQGETLEAQLAYWRRRLTGSPTLLRLPTDHPRPAVETFKGAMHSFVLPLHVSEGVKTLSQREGVTLFMTLLAAFVVLLLRYTGQEDIVVGSPIANRNHAEIERLIGFFVNMLVLRTDLSGDPSFRELLARVREVALGAYAHQDLPFEKLVEELQPERNLGHSPLCQVVFVLQNAPELTLKFTDLTSQIVSVHNKTAKFDLIVSLSEEDEKLSGYFEYNTDLFEATTISRMREHFQTLLEGIITSPETRLSQLPLLTEREYQELLMRPNSQKDMGASNLCLHQLFDAQVERTPDAVALVFDNQCLTYQVLNRRANRVARSLIKAGVEPETLVGLAVERSLELVIGLLGILKAGGAYVPLDTTSPSERLAFQLEDAHISVLLTQRRFSEELPNLREQIRTIYLDTDWEFLAQESTANPSSQVQTANLAYVIYTSGSTGKPKGVLVSHANVVRLFQATDGWFHFDEYDVWTLFHSCAFDFSVWELWGALLFGGRLVVVSYWESRSSESFVHLLKREQVTVLNQTPSAFHALIQVEHSPPATLRLVIFGGEALDMAILKSWFEQEQAPNFVNMYGITETTVHVTSHLVAASDISGAHGSVIGVPIPDLQLYVLDRYLYPVPGGVPGELYVGGRGLTRGYLHRADLTAERFVPHPFSNIPGMRLYKTGDLVRYQYTGELEYLGRVDQQVKLRGFRIELGEIEAHLCQHPQVRDAVAVMREDVPGEKRLIAYIVQDQHDQDRLEQATEKQNAEWIEQWQTLYDETYSQPASSLDPAFNIIGWNSSYTDQPIPQEEMREWTDNTLARILALQPQRVLEIGCGTGLLLLRLAAGCIEYCGTDLSATALRYLQKQLSRPEQELSHVRLMQRPADDFTGVSRGAFDTVILNSVIQYFPSIDYLVEVLEKAIAIVKPGGNIFLGDIRSLPLLEAFHTSVQLYQAPGELPHDQLQLRIQRALINENELVIDPAFFQALQHHFPQITHVQIQQKRGYWHNELTQFRYDVILHLGREVPQYKEPEWFDWQRQGLTVDAIRHLLIEKQPEFLCISSIPNARLTTALKAVALLSSSEKAITAGELRNVAKSNIQGVDPEELWHLSQGLPYTAVVNASFRKDGFYDAIFKRISRDKETPEEIVSSFTKESLQPKPWSHYSNAPLQAKVARELIPHLRSFLQKKLPNYMIPSSFILLDALPLTSNGKLDYRALPAPDTARPELEKTFVAPRTPTEETLARIFAQILGLERVGIHDNFFTLGGHSLLATQAISRVRETFQITLPLRTLFEKPTVAGLAAELLKHEAKEGQVAATARLLKKIEELSADEIRALLQNKKKARG